VQTKFQNPPNPKFFYPFCRNDLRRFLPRPRPIFRTASASSPNSRRPHRPP
jgi:hypothetical protein